MNGHKHKPARGIQVPSEHYASREYDSLERFISYWYQVDAVLRHEPQSVLEVGPGSGLVAGYLANHIPGVWSFDHDLALRPSAVGRLPDLPFDRDAVDVVLCAEVLEHVPFEVAVDSMGELARVARKAVVVSVPDVTPFYRGVLPVPLLGEWRFLIRRPWGRPGRVTNPDEHFWEIGTPECPADRLRDAFRAQGLSLVGEHRIFENPYHHLFELRPLQ